MRTSKDQFINPLGQLINLGQNEQSREFIKEHGLKLWNGYDYDRQMWIRNGAEDTRTIEELRADIDNIARAKELEQSGKLPEYAKDLAMSDIGLTEDEAEMAIEDFENLM